MTKKNFTDELKQLFLYIQDVAAKEYVSNNITTEYFVLSVLENNFSVANRVLSKILLNEAFETTKAHFYECLSRSANNISTKKRYDKLFDDAVVYAQTLAESQKSKTINSGHLLLAVIEKNEEIKAYLKTVGVTLSQVRSQVAEETNNFLNENKAEKTATPKKHEKKQKRKETKNTGPVKRELSIVPLDYVKASDECLADRYLTNLNKQTQVRVYGNERVYEQIFRIFSKHSKNNVVLTGNGGVGKTAIVKNIANLIKDKKVPKAFCDYTMYEADVTTNDIINLCNTLANVDAFIAECAKSKYIIMFDDFNYASDIYLTQLKRIIKRLAKERNVKLIWVTQATNIKEMFPRNLYKEWEQIKIEEPTIEDAKEILKLHTEKLEYFHNVKYEANAITDCVHLCKRYVSDENLPLSAINVLDLAGATVSLSEEEPKAVLDLRKKLDKLTALKTKLRKSGGDKEYERIQEVEEKETQLQSELDLAIKNYNLQKEPLKVTSAIIKECIAKKTNIPICELNSNDRAVLKNLNNKVKGIVVGQDEAVDSVCRVIKRQRVGMGNPNKPSVFLMIGCTGVGKTYLAKTLAKILFGDEKKLVRLDMAQYNDPQMGVSTLTGSGKGFVGYESGGILTEAIKQHKHCVLLLDEIEKAHKDVHNLFLSIFDDGRLMDSKGVNVDFRNVIIMMTSNVGAKEAEERNSNIGFISQGDDFKRDIIEKEVKRKFSPEFINRIDKIVYFNQLTDENIHSIVNLEVDKLRKRLETNGYGLSDDFEQCQMVKEIYEKAIKNKNMGARPILREMQTTLEDTITDFMIENDIERGHIFTYEELVEN